MVLLTAIEFNRDSDEKVSVEGPEKKPLNVIHCDKKEEENEELGTNKIERNVEAAWSNRSKSTVGGKEQICCMSWYKVFRFLGKTEN